jgi:hypothetical protein
MSFDTTPWSDETVARLNAEQKIVNRYMRWKENALARYPLPSTANEQEKTTLLRVYFGIFSGA